MLSRRLLDGKKKKEETLILAGHCHVVRLGAAVAEVAQQRGRRDSAFIVECFVVIISWFYAWYDTSLLDPDPTFSESRVCVFKSELRRGKWRPFSFSVSIMAAIPRTS